jgi:hypothetical protein
MKSCRLAAFLLMTGLFMALCSCGPFGIIPLGAAAAGGGGGGGDGGGASPASGFRVVSIDPYKNQQGVYVHYPITVCFSHAVDPLSVTGTSFVVSTPSGPVTGIYRFRQQNTEVIFTADSAYPAHSTITVDINNITQASDPAKVITNYKSSFTTGTSSPQAPYVVSVVPVDCSTVPLQPYMPVRVLFSEPMNSGTVTTASFYIYHVEGGGMLSGSVSADAQNREFTFTPSAALVDLNHYEIHVLLTVTSQSGLSMTSDFVSYFDTVDLKPTLVMIPSSSANLMDEINAGTVSSVTVTVGLNTETEYNDTVQVHLTDGANHVYADRLAQQDGAGNVSLLGIDASSLAEGSITLEAWLIRCDVMSRIEAASVWKDTVVPNISLSKPSPLPQYYERRMLELNVTADSNCTLQMNGGLSSVATGIVAGANQVDYELNLAGINNIQIYAFDGSLNRSTEFTQTVYHRGGVGGGSLTGSTLTVSVYYQSNLRPVSGAMVIRGYNTETGTTNANGEVTFDNITGPQAITVIRSGYPMFSVLDVDAQRVSIPIIDDFEGMTPDFATISGIVTPNATNGMLDVSNDVSDETNDYDMDDGDYQVRVKPNRDFTIAAINNAGGPFSNFVMKDGIGPLDSGAMVATEDLIFDMATPPVATTLASGDVTLPTGFYLPAALLWERGKCVIMSRSRAESDRFVCGYGIVPLAPVTGGPFAYSSISPGYFDTPSSEYWMVLQFRDIYYNEISASASFPPGGPLPDFVFPEMPKLEKPGTCGVITTLTPTFEWSDSNVNGLHLLMIMNVDDMTTWIIARQGGIFSATLPEIPALAPFRVVDFGNPATQLMWRLESNHRATPLDYNNFSFADEFESGTDFTLATGWQTFFAWDPDRPPAGRVPGLGVAGEPAGALTVTVIDEETDSPVQGASVYLGDTPSNVQTTDFRGQVVFNNPPVPAKLTICYPGYPYMTCDKVDAAYVTLPLSSDYDGTTFTLYGVVTGLTGSSGSVTASNERGHWFNIFDNAASMLTDDQTPPNTPFDGPDPENYSLILSEREDYQVVTGFADVAVGDAIFDFAYFSDIFEVNPSGTPPFLQAPDIDFVTNGALGYSPMRRVTDPSDLYMPSNLVGGALVDRCNVDPLGKTTQNPDLYPTRVKIGRGETTVDGGDPFLYHYGITFATPPNFKLDELGLMLEAKGFNADGTGWNSELILRKLAAYPRYLSMALPDIPYPISPVNGDTGVGLTPEIRWNNVAQGKQGYYMIMLGRETPSPFFWVLLTPIPEAGPEASITVPALPAGFNGPELGVVQVYQIQSNTVPGLDVSSWMGNVFDEQADGYTEWKDGFFTP